MAKISGRQLGLELCEAFGINSDGVRSITLRACATEAATLTVEHYVRGEDIDATVLKRYRLEEIAVEEVAGG